LVGIDRCGTVVQVAVNGFGVAKQGATFAVGTAVLGAEKATDIAKSGTTLAVGTAALAGQKAYEGGKQVTHPMHACLMLAGWSSAILVQAEVM
jgi:hypothetical protein